MSAEKPGNEKLVAIAREVADDTVKLVAQLDELIADAEHCRFHRAVLRLGRARMLLRMVAPALRTQARKLENNRTLA